jgi:hypothetical protein
VRHCAAFRLNTESEWQLYHSVQLSVTDPKRVVSTICCGPLGGIHPYPAHHPLHQLSFPRRVEAEKEKNGAGVDGSWYWSEVVLEEKRQLFVV